MLHAGNGVIDEDEERCLHCGGPITYVACSECHTRVTLDILWRIENSSIHPREMMLPLHVSLRRFIDGTPQDVFSLTLVQFPIMFGINEKRGALHFDSPGLIWIDTPNRESSIYVFDEDVKYDRQTEPLKIFEALLSRTFSPYRYPRSSVKSILQRGSGYREKAFTQGFSRRMAKIARTTLPVSNGFTFECITSAVNSLTHNMAIINQNSILAKKLIAPSVVHKIILLRPGDILAPNPQGKGKPINLDDDGIVAIGALVNPGDVLVGIVRVEKQRATTAEERLLTALFGAKMIPIDRSRVYCGIIPARVIAVEVETSRGDAFHLYPGKTIKKAEYGQSEQITITLSLEQLIGIGDTLYAEDNSKVVICETANGSRLKDLAKCTVEPDLLISTNHPWAAICLETSSKCYPLQISIKPDTLNGQNINTRASGYYSLIDHQPIKYASNYNVAQIMTKDDFSWLLNYGLMDIVFELLHIHSDCIGGRTNLYKSAKSDPISLDEMCNSSLTPPTDLVNAPGETIRYLAFLLRGLGIRVSIEFTPKPMMRFHVIEDSDRLAWSRGEVTRPSPIDYAITRSAPNGLFSEHIFGPTEDWNCTCGKYKDTPWFEGIICDRCGVEVTRSTARRERVGHIELAIPVINPLYLDYVCSALSNILPLKYSEIKSLIYYERLGESERRKMASRIGKDDLKDENFTLVLQEIVKESSRIEEDHKSRIVSLIGKDERGASAIQKLIEYHMTPADARKHHLYLERVIMKSVLVIPPDLRRDVQFDNGRVASSHLDYLYSRVISRNNYLRDLINSNKSRENIFKASRDLQEAINVLFLNSILTTPQKTDFGDTLRSLSGSITQFKPECSTFLDMLLERPLDYTAQIRITVGYTGDIDLAFLPESVAYELFKPFVGKQLSKNPSFDYTKFPILISTDSAFSRFIALRFQLTHDLTLKVHSDVMDLLGWELLGNSARIFALFSDEAIEEALSTLTPSRLVQQKSPTIVLNSLLDVAKEDLVPFIATRALLQEAIPIGPYEWFLTFPFRHPKTE